MEPKINDWILPDPLWAKYKIKKRIMGIIPKTKGTRDNRAKNWNGL